MLSTDKKKIENKKIRKIKTKQKIEEKMHPNARSIQRVTRGGAGATQKTVPCNVSPGVTPIKFSAGSMLWG